MVSNKKVNAVGGWRVGTGSHVPRITETGSTAQFTSTHPWKATRYLQDDASYQSAHNVLLVSIYHGYQTLRLQLTSRREIDAMIGEVGDQVTANAAEANASRMRDASLLQDFCTKRKKDARRELVQRQSKSEPLETKLHISRVRNCDGSERLSRITPWRIQMDMAIYMRELKYGRRYLQTSLKTAQVLLSRFSIFQEPGAAITPHSSHSPPPSLCLFGLLALLPVPCYPKAIRTSPEVLCCFPTHLRSPFNCCPRSTLDACKASAIAVYSMSLHTTTTTRNYRLPERKESTEESSWKKRTTVRWQSKTSNRKLVNRSATMPKPYKHNIRENSQTANYNGASVCTMQRWDERCLMRRAPNSDVQLLGVVSVNNVPIN
ncbi:hypothetical protein BZA77DRAFT_373419 [Pyronema omphalodes]|nr:hypothetical protein BZA77DRAFT_373419 [Pyronema omphalodes]